MMYGAVPGAEGDPPTPDRNRNVDYFHSTFVDLVIGGLLGVRGSLLDDRVLVNPRARARSRGGRGGGSAPLGRLRSGAYATRA